MRHEVQERLAKAGIEVIEARISHLAYAPEIAGAMLRRQQASAVIAARQKIVEGAVGMVEMALERIEPQERRALDEERKAAMVSNLLVVLCSERGVEPVVNAGTLYQNVRQPDVAMSDKSDSLFGSTRRSTTRCSDGPRRLPQRQRADRVSAPLRAAGRRTSTRIDDTSQEAASAKKKRAR